MKLKNITNNFDVSAIRHTGQFPEQCLLSYRSWTTQFNIFCVLIVSLGLIGNI